MQGSELRVPSSIFSADVAVEGDRPLQLRDLAEMLRKTAEPQTVVKALALVAPLIEAAPDELANYSGAVPRPQHPRHGSIVTRQKSPACQHLTVVSFCA